MFPVELFVHIARLDNWRVSGPLARSSRSFLMEFTQPSVLKEIVNAHKMDIALPKWLTFALSSCYLPLPVQLEERIALYLRDDSISLDTSSRFADNIFVTGGHVCQRIYGLQWESDVDVYTHTDLSQVSTICQASYEGMALDLHATTHSPIYAVIESFDLSIVQQGFIGRMFVLTPLALYTQVYCEIVAIPSISNIQYRMPRGRGGFDNISRDIWHYIKSHRDHQHQTNLAFHDCSICSRTQGMVPLLEWKARVKKYCERFPSFTISFCRAPAITHTQTVRNPP